MSDVVWQYLADTAVTLFEWRMARHPIALPMVVTDGSMSNGGIHLVRGN